jgi:hypothetical protein
MFKFIRRMFANLAKASEPTDAGKTPYPRTGAYMASVEDNLDRYFGLSIERRNQHIPVLRPDQFDRDVGSTRNARIGNPRRIENNTTSLQ